MALTDTTSGGRQERELRQRFPRFGQVLDDYFVMLSVPSAFNWAEMPRGWRRAIRVLAIEYQRITAQTQSGMQTSLRAMKGALTGK